MGGAFYIGFMFTFGTDAGDAEELFQLVQMLIAPRLDVLNQVHCQGPPSNKIAMPAPANSVARDECASLLRHQTRL